MKRKTNLFYTTGSDSNFIVFSNYTESMTGNFLATNIKLFPSKFLCLKIDNLVNRREEFIKHLAAYYENKLAFLRDWCIEHNKNVEETIKPLGYLLEAIELFDPNYNISFIGQVTEQDYNGIYADTICVIDSTSSNHGIIIKEDVDEDLNINIDYSEVEVENQLYGWYKRLSPETSEYIGPKEYKGVSPIFDNDNIYRTSSVISKIQKIDTSNEKVDIEFNCVIPLFDVININHHENYDQIQDMTEIDCMTKNKHPYVTNVPLGVWFANEDKLLTRAGTGYAPSWSLVLSSQFKPFPYSSEKISTIDQSDRMDAFSTFAQILSRQNKILDKMSVFSTTLNKFGERISNIEANLKSIGTGNNIDGVHTELISLKKDLNNSINDVKNELGNDLSQNFKTLKRDITKEIHDSLN